MLFKNIPSSLVPKYSALCSIKVILLLQIKSAPQTHVQEILNEVFFFPLEVLFSKQIKAPIDGVKDQI